jgi:hypothetical protein
MSSLLYTGSVPVYLGDAAHLKSLLPDPKAAIYVADYPNIEALAAYLKYLTTNETAYEEHKAWRKTYNLEQLKREKPLLQNSWYCRVCRWAVANAHTHRKRTRVCSNSGSGTTGIGVGAGVVGSTKISNADGLKSSNALKERRLDLNGKAVRGHSGKQLFVVQNGTLHLVPDMDTFKSLHLQLSEVALLPDFELKSIVIGEPMARQT